MVMQERRKSQRSSGFLIVNFRNLKSIKQHTSGITANISHEGLGLESQRLYYTPGEILEIILKDPHSKLSVSAEGEVVWRRDKWYKCEMGIRLRQETTATGSKILEVLSRGNKMTAEPPLPDENNGRPETGTNDGKNDLMGPEMPDRSTVTAAKIDKAIYLGAMNSKLNRKSIDEKPQTLLKKGAGSYSEGIVLKKTFMSAPRKKSRILAVFLTGLSVVLLVAAALKFHDIKKVLPLNVQAEKFIFSQNRNEKRDVSFSVGDRPVDSGHREHEGPLRVSNDRGIQHTPSTEKAETVAQQSLPEGEGILHINDLALTIIFDYNSDAVDPEFYGKIENIANVLLAGPERTVKVEGHTDDIGSEMYNMDLSMRRALAVKKILNRKGIESERIKISYMGESNPVSLDLKESGRMRNRRVEISVVPAAD